MVMPRPDGHDQRNGCFTCLLRSRIGSVPEHVSRPFDEQIQASKTAGLDGDAVPNLSLHPSQRQRVGQQNPVPMGEETPRV
jgi:hypothetical protein